jgi:WD40 repeat protein
MKRVIIFWNVSIILLTLTGCPSGRTPVTADLTRPTAMGDYKGEIVDVRFTADSKALFGRAVPLGKDPAARPPLGEYRLWDLSTGRELRRLPLEEKVLEYGPGTADGRHWFALGNLGGLSLRIAFVEFDPEKRVLDPPEVGPEKSITKPSFSQNFTRLAYVIQNKENRNQKGHVFQKKDNGWEKLMSAPADHIKLSPDGRRVATVFRDGLKPLTLRVLSVPEGKLLGAGTCRTFGLMGFTPDSKYVIQNDQTAWKLYDSDTGEVKLSLTVTEPFLAAYADDRVIATSGSKEKADQVIVTWDVRTGNEIGRRPLSPTVALSRTQNTPFSAPLLAVVRGIENRPLPGKKGVYLEVGTVDVFNPSRPEPLTTIKTTSLSRVMVSPDGSTLVIVSIGGGPAFFQLPGR